MRKFKLNRFTRKEANLQSQKARPDLALLFATVVLVIFGLMMVYDASAVAGLKDAGDSLYYIRQQLLWAGLGTMLMIFFSGFSFLKFKALALPLIIFSFVLLVAVFIPGLGVAGGGAHRWLKIAGITVQPAEIIKLTSVLFLAALFEKGTRFLPFALLTGAVSFVTAVLQKDLGSTIVFALTSAVIYFYAGAPVWHFFAAIPAAAVAFAGLVLTAPYRLKRILAFLDPFSDPQGYTYHISQVLIALGSGGLFGLGLGHSRQKFSYIPEVTTDSIFAIIGEELGFLGGIFLIVFFALLLYRGFKIAQKCEHTFGRILAIGITSWLGIQIIVNLSSMTALLPLTGVPLPFISYGGSALVANLLAVGILLNISRQNRI